jgi:hypothetical protein
MDRCEACGILFTTAADGQRVCTPRCAVRLVRSQPAPVRPFIQGTATVAEALALTRRNVADLRAAARAKARALKGEP